MTRVKFVVNGIKYKTLAEAREHETEENKVIVEHIEDFDSLAKIREE